MSYQLTGDIDHEQTANPAEVDEADEICFESSEEWLSWVGSRVAETDAAYLAKPDFMAGHYKGERSTAKDYAGRELLELLQNAADAAMEAGGQGRVRIDVTEHGLCVANTGKPFRTGGVRSLMTSHTSDKPEQKVALIGAKGLGFRSLLNWSVEPFITSGELEIGFSRDAAVRHVESLALTNSKIRKLLASSGPKPVPVLAFPLVGSDLAQIDGLPITSLIDHARAMRASGYDTGHLDF
ncbi:hypothetical protein RNZ50_08145 [Paracoccaceae bacterium Fryx2]|nr:hypothetical protein [Paracoccaceae bacterium Fryx2]